MSEYERVLSLIEDALAGESDGAIRVPVVDLKTLIAGRPEHDRQVAERAWDEGFDAGRDDLGAAAVAIEHGEDENPYRKNGRSE